MRTPGRHEVIDLRSDTVTRPTPEMRKAMAEAVVGDDCHGEDPTVQELEARAADVMGKEAAMFVPSGTMGNSCALLAHGRPGEIALMDAECHVYVFEQGGLAALAGLMPVLWESPNGCPSPDFVQSYMNRSPRMYPRTAVVCLENTHNRRGGRVMSPDEMAAIHDVTSAAGVPLHLDGARIFNAAVALGVPVRRIADQVDTVQFCLSKGLGAPVGSILVSDTAFIDRARLTRKRLGGSMRQSGVIAAAGIIALTEMHKCLAEDHENARMLAEVLADIPELGVDPAVVETNMVNVRTAGVGVAADKAAAALKEQGVGVAVYGPTTLRFVTHHDASRDDVKRAATIAAEVFSSFRSDSQSAASPTR